MINIEVNDMDNFSIKYLKLKLIIIKMSNMGKLTLLIKNVIYQANILGLYGQNGSGKTTLVNILKY